MTEYLHTLIVLFNDYYVLARCCFNDFSFYRMTEYSTNLMILLNEYVARWFTTCAARPAFVAALGAEPLCVVAKKAKKTAKKGAVKQGLTKKEKKALREKEAANKVRSLF